MADEIQGQPVPQGQGADPTQDAAKASQQTEFMIPKRRFDEVSQMYRDSLAKNSELQKEIESSKQKDAKIAELEKKIKDMESSYELEKANAKKASAIDKAIGDTAIDAEVIKKLLDMDKISINDKGEVEGLEDQIKLLQKDRAFLFKKSLPVASKSATPATRPEKSVAQKLAEKRVTAMSASAKAKNYFN